MANAKSSTTWYVDSTGDLDGSDSYVSVNVYSIVLSSTGSGGSMVLTDKQTDAEKIRVNVAANETIFLRFEDHPINFSGGIGVSTISNAVATLIYSKVGG